MVKDAKKTIEKHCWACVQWDGPRTLDPKTKAVKVDKTREDNCRVYHKKTKGMATCERFFPLG